MPEITSVDPRGLRFVASATAATLALVLVAPTNLQIALLSFQTVLFGLGAFVSLQASPWSWLFRTFVRPRIGAPTETEDSRPPRFAQLVGFVFAAIGLVAFVVGATTVGLIAVAFAFAAALLNATTGFCLGCEMYLTTRRLAKQLA